MSGVARNHPRVDHRRTVLVTAAALAMGLFFVGARPGPVWVAAVCAIVTGLLQQALP